MGGSEGDAVQEGKKTPSWPTGAVCSSADSRFASMRRDAAPWGVGFVWWLREGGGIWQPIAMPEVVENQAAGRLGFFSRTGDGFPG